MSSSFESEDLLECARSLRPYLPNLLGTEAQHVDRQLADLLAAARMGRQVDDQILELLKSNAETRNWAAEFLSQIPVSKGLYEPLPGSSGSVSTPKYICPEGDYVWYRRSVSLPIPSCPTHPELGELIRADEG